MRPPVVSHSHPTRVHVASPAPLPAPWPAPADEAQIAEEARAHLARLERLKLNLGDLQQWRETEAVLVALPPADAVSARSFINQTNRGTDRLVCLTALQQHGCVPRRALLLLCPIQLPTHAPRARRCSATGSDPRGAPLVRIALQRSPPGAVGAPNPPFPQPRPPPIFRQQEPRLDIDAGYLQAVAAAVAELGLEQEVALEDAEVAQVRGTYMV